MILTFCSFLGYAQNAKRAFSLDEAMDYALKNRREVLNAVADEEIAAAQRREVFGRGLPQVNASLDVSDYVELPTSLIPAEFFGGQPGEYAEVQFGRKFNANAGISANQLLFSGTYIVAVQNSSEFIELAKKNTMKTEQDIAYEVAKAYYAVLINQERIALIDNNVESLKKIMDETEKMFEAGFVEKLDLDRIKVSYNNLRIERENVSNSMELGRALLKYQMGLNIDQEIELTGELNEVLIEQVNPELNDFQYNNRVEHQMVSQQIEIAYKLRKLESVGYLPTLSLYGSYSVQAQRDEFNFLSGNEDWYPIGIIGLQMNLNLFDGLQRKERIEQRSLAIQKAENNKIMLEKAIDLETESALINLENALASMESQRENMELANSVLDTTSKKYSSGTGSSIEVIEAENALKEAQTNYYNALFNAIVAKLEFEKATGKFNVTQ